MDKHPYASAYRTAAILHAFSQPGATAEVPVRHDAWNTAAAPLEPQSPWWDMVRRAFRAGYARLRLARSMRLRDKADAGADPAGIAPVVERDAGPPLVSHFAFCDNAEHRGAETPL